MYGGDDTLGYKMRKITSEDDLLQAGFNWIIEQGIATLEQMMDAYIDETGDVEDFVVHWQNSVGFTISMVIVIHNRLFKANNVKAYKSLDGDVYVTPWEFERHC